MAELEPLQKIRLAETPPVACASCFGQYTDRRHVDFGAAYEGPVLPSGEETKGVVGVVVDDLIVCEECLRAAAALIGMEDATESRANSDALAARVEEMGERLAGAIAYINKMETANAQREELAAALKPKSRAKRTA